MSLLTKASLIATPTAYGDGVLNSVKPTDGAGDFDFARASSATRVNEEGLIEKERENVMLYSQDFTNAQWVAFNATKTTGQSDPNGGNTAVRVVSTAVVNSGLYVLDTTNFGTNKMRTASVWMKGAVGGEVVQMGDATNRVSVTLTTNWVRYEAYAIDNSTYFVLYSNSTAQTWDVAFAQYEDGLVATDYIETTTSSVAVGITNDIPRINYENGIGNFLLEPQRTNLLQQSEYVNGSQDVSNVTITTNATTSPDGKINASKIVPNTSNTFHWFGETVSGSAGVYTASVFAKADTYNHLYIVLRTDGGVNRYGVKFDLSTGLFLDDITYALPTQTNYAIEDYGNGWYRCSVMAYNTIGNVVALFGPSLGGLLFDINNSFAGNGTSGIYVWGAQLEDGYITSYIPCYGSATTRAAETCNNAGNSDLFNDSEGVLYAEFSAFVGAGGGTRRISIGDSLTPSQYVRLQIANGDGSLYGAVNNGAEQFLFNYTSFNAIQNNKVAIKYKENDFALWVNGVEVGTDTSGTTFSSNTLTKLNFGSGSSIFYGKIKMVATFKEALSDSELECLTTI